MAKASELVKPDRQQLIRLEVLRSERISPHFQRVTVGGGSIDQFTPMGWDQWFRMFIPTAGETGLDQLPDRVNLLGYLRYLRIDKGERPVLRNYTVRAFRPVGVSGPELDIDFVLHGSVEDGTAGPASTWAQTCRPGDPIGIVDEGIAFNPGRGTDRVLLLADETGVPAAAGVLASLPDTATGTAILEVPTPEDRFDLSHPPGVDVWWLSRPAEAHAGDIALPALVTVSPGTGVHAFLVGEQSMVQGARRHLVATGVPKDRISFVGYWRRGTAGH